MTTSQPSPAAFARAYAHAVERGAREIVSVHLSGELSGTVSAAGLAALAAPVPVHVVDSRSVAMGLGLAAVAAAELVAGSPAGGRRRPFPAAGFVAGPAGPAGPACPADGAAAAERARQVAASTSIVFLVDSLEHLRRGGRMSATAAAMGTVLGLRPLLALRSGRIEVAEKVRTRRAARERLEALALEALALKNLAGREGAQVCVHHLGQPELALALADRIRARPGVGEVSVSEISAVLAAHAGPGLLAVVVADR